MIYKYSALMIAGITITSEPIFIQILREHYFRLALISFFLFKEEPSSPPPSQRWTDADGDA